MAEASDDAGQREPAFACRHPRAEVARRADGEALLRRGRRNAVRLCATDTVTAPISRYPVPTLAELPDDIRARMLEVQEKAGFIPNVFVTLAHRPDEFRAFFAYHDALMLRDSGLSKAEREMIVVATSGVNHCPYCVIAHGAILRIYAKNAYIADEVAIDYRKADISERQQAMLDFAVKLARTPEAIAE